MLYCSTGGKEALPYLLRILEGETFAENRSHSGRISSIKARDGKRTLHGRFTVNHGGAGVATVLRNEIAADGLRSAFNAEELIFTASVEFLRMIYSVKTLSNPARSRRSSTTFSRASWA